MWKSKVTFSNHNSSTLNPVIRQTNLRSIPILCFSRPGARDIFPPQRPYQHLGPSSLLYNGYRELFPRRYRDREVKLTTHLLSQYVFPEWCLINYSQEQTLSSTFYIPLSTICFVQLTFLYLQASIIINKLHL